MNHIRVLVLILCLSWGIPCGAESVPGATDSAALATKSASLLTSEVLAEVHRTFSVDCFNQCWALIDRADRSRDDTEIMLAMAHASFLHWQNRPDCKPENLSIAYWLLARVHALAGHFEAARWYASKCLSYSSDKALAPFYIGYAHEAMCRAEKGLKETEAALGDLKLAEGQLEKVTDPEEKKLLADDLRSLREALATP